jgi:glycosyltransferase involved in cell wall biosynthesis
MKSRPSPAVSVVMSAYNGERFLREAVESILRQTFSDFELIVVDDGSTDATPRMLAEYAAADSRVVVHRQSNQGHAAGLNCGIGLARAPLIARIDADDAALPTRLERQSRFLIEHATVAVVGGAVTFIDESGRSFADVPYPLTDAEIRETLTKMSAPFLHPAVMLRRDAFERVGGYRPVFQVAEDYDLWLRIAECYELANLPEIVLRYRIHAKQTTVQNLERGTLAMFAARTSARARKARCPDPLEKVDRIDYQILFAAGVTNNDITAAIVYNTTWWAKTLSRAGYAREGERLFAEAAARARSATGSPALVAHVHRQYAHRLREQGSRYRALFETVRAALAQRVIARLPGRVRRFLLGRMRRIQDSFRFRTFEWL